MVQSKLLLKFKDIDCYFFDKFDSVNLIKFGINQDECISCQQVHGNKIVVVKDLHSRYYRDCDGIVTGESLFLLIRTADCLPLFLYDPRSRIVAAVHAGWRGIYSGVIINAIKEMTRLGCIPKNLVSAIGPSIKSCCYHVSYERIVKFQEKYRTVKVSKQKKGNWYLDLEKTAFFQMVNLGVLRENIDIISICTCCDKRFFSLRRDGSSTGRMFSLIHMAD